MSNENPVPEDKFELFGTPAEDNLKEILARGSYKWTNKATSVLAVALLVVTSVSAGVWYGHRQNGATTQSSTRSLSSFRTSGANFGSGGNFGSGNAGGSGGFGGGGNFPGRGTSATVDSVKGNTVTITVDKLSSSNLSSVKAGDKVTVRASNGGGGGFGAPSGTAQPLTAPGASSSSTTSTKKSSSKSGTTPSAKPTLGAPTGGQTDGQPGGQGGFGNRQGGGGGFNNPELTACLKENGVTITPGTRPDRSDTKVQAALQACFAKLGGGQFGGGQNGAPRPAPTATP